MANQFQNKLVTAIRDFLLAGKPARVGKLGVFCLVHREPEEKMREDGSVILSPPANVIEFMPDENLRIINENPLLKRLRSELLYDSEILKKAVSDFANDIYNSSKECSVLVQGLGSFKTINGILTFKTSPDLATEANKVYEGLKEIELVQPSRRTSKDTISNSDTDVYTDEDELISVIKTKDDKFELPKSTNKNHDSSWVSEYEAPELPKSGSLPETDDEGEIDIFGDKDSNLKSAKHPGKNEDDFKPEEPTARYEFGYGLGFDDGLENFGKPKSGSGWSDSENRNPVIGHDEDEEVNIFRDSGFIPTVDAGDEQDEINVIENDNDFARPGLNKKTDLEWPEESASTVHDFSDDDFFSRKQEKDTRKEDAFFNPPPQERFVDDLKPFSFKISLQDDTPAKQVSENASEQEKRRIETKNRNEADQQKLRKEKQKQAESFESRRKALNETSDTAELGSFTFRKKPAGNRNADKTHFEDNIISPVLPGKDDERSDKGVGIAISLAAMILFGIMIFLVYSLFPAEEADYVQLAGRSALAADQLPGTETGENDLLQAQDLPAANQQQQQSALPSDGALTYDDILLELTRQNRGGLFGLYGDFNENISPFYGIILYASTFRSEADDMARSFEERDWRTRTIPHDRSDGSRVWRVMVGQFSTLADANVEARLLPSQYRQEFLIQRFDADQ